MGFTYVFDSQAADGLLRDVEPRDLDLVREALLRDAGPLSG